MLKIEFEKTDGVYTLRDAIVLPDDHGLTVTAIEAIKQQRWDNWIAIITAPPTAYVLDENEVPVLDTNGIPILAEVTNG